MSTTSEGGRDIAAGFAYVLDVYRNTSRMLLACDPVLQQYGFQPYSWAAAENERPLATQPTTWLLHRAVRQYYPPDRKDREILTIGALFHDPWGSEAVEPLCIASMMAVSSCPNAVYWLGLAGLWSPTAGKVVVVRGDQLEDPSLRNEFARIVRDDRALAVAVPLVEITSTTHVEERLLKPLLHRLENPAPGAFVMPSAADGTG